MIVLKLIGKHFGGMIAVILVIIVTVYVYIDFKSTVFDLKDYTEAYTTKNNFYNQFIQRNDELIKEEEEADTAGTPDATVANQGATADVWTIDEEGTIYAGEDSSKVDTGITSIKDYYKQLRGDLNRGYLDGQKVWNDGNYIPNKKVRYVANTGIVENYIEKFSGILSNFKKGNPDMNKAHSLKVSSGPSDLLEYKGRIAFAAPQYFGMATKEAGKVLNSGSYDLIHLWQCYNLTYKCLDGSIPDITIPVFSVDTKSSGKEFVNGLIAVLHSIYNKNAKSVNGLYMEPKPRFSASYGQKEKLQKFLLENKSLSVAHTGSSKIDFMELVQCSYSTSTNGKLKSDLETLRNGKEWILVKIEHVWDDNFKDELKALRGNYLPLEWGYKG